MKQRGAQLSFQLSFAKTVRLWGSACRGQEDVNILETQRRIKSSNVRPLS